MDKTIEHIRAGQGHASGMNSLLSHGLAGFSLACLLLLAACPRQPAANSSTAATTQRSSAATASAAPDGDAGRIAALSPAEAYTELEALDGGVDCARFIDHCAAGDMKALRLYLRSGSDPSCGQGVPERGSGLMAAAVSGQTEVVRLLLDGGADVSAADADSGLDALGLAAREGQLEIVRLLLAAGANPRHFDKASMTPLHAAAARGHLDVVREFIAQGLEVDLLSEKKGENLGGITPLIYAALGGHSEVAHYLIEEAGADPAHVANNGATPAMAALHLKHLELARYLASRGSPPLAFYNGNMSTLALAAQIGYLEGIEWLVRDEGLDVNTRNKRDLSSPLLVSVRNGYLKQTKVLLELGADTGLRDADGKTAMDYAQDAQNQLLIDILEGKEVEIPEAPAGDAAAGTPVSVP